MKTFLKTLIGFGPTKKSTRSNGEIAAQLANKYGTAIAVQFMLKAVR